MERTTQQNTTSFESERWVRSRKECFLKLEKGKPGNHDARRHGAMEPFFWTREREIMSQKSIESRKDSPVLYAAQGNK